MYNSQNLPLSPRKVIKKFLASQFRLLPATTLISLLLMPFILAFDSFVYKSVPLDSSFLMFLPLLIVVGIAIIVLLESLTLLYHYLYYRFYYYNFEENRAEIKKGVIQIATGMVRYERLQNIYIDQDILDRIFGLYDVHYETAGESSNFYSHVDGLNKENANKLIAFLNSRLDETENSKNNKEPIINPSQETAQNIYYTRENLPLASNVLTAWAISGFLIALFFGWFFGVVFVGLSGWLFGLILYSIIVIAFTLIFYIVNSIWLKNFAFTFDDSKGEIITQVLARSVSYVYYNRIQNINVNQGLIDRFFGISNVLIETAGGGIVMGNSQQRGRGSILPRMRIPGLLTKEAETLKNFLLEKSEKAKNNL